VKTFLCLRSIGCMLCRWTYSSSPINKESWLMFSSASEGGCLVIKASELWNNRRWVT
jgi:hypothetical protein